ncbi:hypothetical protein [Haloglomus litoreum]|uniref:hypothetical protein n=1 Tax=Haloglomus litoreum TaxID=3034026 RepID=UPI0023E775EF|nr:hypothetical protein [Haloglomus sp. DT116]
MVCDDDPRIPNDLWSGLTVLWALALVVAYELSTARMLPAPEAVPDEAAAAGRGY